MNNIGGGGMPNLTVTAILKPQSAQQNPDWALVPEFPIAPLDKVSASHPHGD